MFVRAANTCACLFVCARGYSSLLRFRACAGRVLRVCFPFIKTCALSDSLFDSGERDERRRRGFAVGKRAHRSLGGHCQQTERSHGSSRPFEPQDQFAHAPGHHGECENEYLCERKWVLFFRLLNLHIPMYEFYAQSKRCTAHFLKEILFLFNVLLFILTLFFPRCNVKSTYLRSPSVPLRWVV